MSNKTILVVEDNELNMKLVLALLNIGQYRVLQAETGSKGLALARESLPDLVLMDIQLPDVDGLTATKQLKADPATAHIPIIALTGYAMTDDEKKAYDAGCQGYLSKPIDTKTFLKTIAGYLSGSDPVLERNTVSTTPTILIVDDDPLNVKLLKTLLSTEYRTMTACDGAEALEKVNDSPPDLILLDIMMPKVNGYEVTRRIKNDPQTRNIPIILITALGGAEDKALGSEAGADEFLNKPVNKAELKARVKSLIKLKVYQEQLSSRIQSEEELVTLIDDDGAPGNNAELPTILLVEDCQKDINLFKLYLAQQPFRLMTVSSGEAALSTCLRESIDLVLLDLFLPGLDGFDVCRRLKEGEQTRNIQVVMVSSHQDLESKLKGLELGADEFLMKPVNKDELAVRIRSLVKKKLYLDTLLSRVETAMNAAITDKLTGLYNHTYLKHFMAHEVKRCDRQHQSMAFIMIDIDDFKQYNDTYGHPAGDTLLRLFGQLIQQSIREVDLAARYGGEEFAVVLPYTDCESAHETAKRILGNIRNSSLSEGPARRCERKTASLGIACYPGDAQTVEDLIQRADEAMYRAKKQGKNQVCSC